MKPPCLKGTYPSIVKTTTTCSWNGMDEEFLKTVIVDYGPVAVVIAATQGLISYKGGVFNDPSCPNESNHAVVSL